jgi:hypothetical protein
LVQPNIDLWEKRCHIWGATLLRLYVNDRQFVEFKCACGQIGIKDRPSITAGQAVVCTSCAKQRQGRNRGQGEERIRLYFADKDADFVRVEQYGRRDGQSKSLTVRFKCACGQEHVRRQDELLKTLNPMCSICVRTRGTFAHGSANPRYDSSIPEHERANRRLGPVEAWARAVFELYSHRCVISGRTVDLAAHHIHNWRDYPDRRFDVINGVPLHRPLHIRFHSQYGNRHNDLGQFQEFFFRQTGAIFLLRVHS